ncbi:MAG: glycosyltransferase [Planctomycetota bacterium]|nr:glycosyltransferase [Planctomycetota bacterium]
MNVFMLGWEFPPFISGGLGTACQGLTRAMSLLGHRVIFVLPHDVAEQHATHVKLLTPKTHESARAAYAKFKINSLENVSFRSIPSTMRPYGLETGGVKTGGIEKTTVRSQSIVADGETSVSFTKSEAGGERTVAVPGTVRSPSGHYGGDMFEEVERYAAVAVEIARNETFEVIHAHDWMTFQAGIAVSRASGKPLVVHVHSTEFDRSGTRVNQPIYDIERRGVHTADRVIAVSHLTRNILLARYSAPPERVEVVYNGISEDEETMQVPPPIRRDEKIVLFLGRITMQKGPEYFLAAAKKVLEYEKNVRFVMAGSGDMTRGIIEMAAEMGIGHRVVFTGFLRGPDVARVFKMADLYVMPSVSEPFGIAPLEALSHDVPVLISKQSGVSEVLTHALKVDFWDIDEMANKIIAVLRHPPLQVTLRDHGNFEIKKFTWTDAASNCIGVYGRAIRDAGRRRAG